MGIFDRLFRKGNLKIPNRHRSAAYMNLAFGITPTAADLTPSAWDTPPVPLTTLTNGDPMTHFTTPGLHDDADQTFIEIDLGTEFEIYEINVLNEGAATGFMKDAAGADVDFHLIVGITGEDVSTGTTLDTQTVAGDGADKDSTLEYVGNGVAARYIWVEFTGEVGDDTEVDLSQIKVFGC